MMTVVTTMKVNPQTRGEWDAVIRERFRSAHDRPGWVGGQLLAPANTPDALVIVGTWESREAWEAWHSDPAFLESRNRLEDLQAGEQLMVWYDVLEDARAS